MPSTLTTCIKTWDTHVRTRMEAETRTLLQEARAYHVKVTASWQQKPAFLSLLTKDRNQIAGVLAISQHATPWKWVDRGTGQWGPRKAPYFIFPRFKPALRFQTGYQPRTQPVAKWDVGPGRAFGAWRTVTTFVVHPGIKPRQFTKDWADKARPDYVKNILAAMLQE